MIKKIINKIKRLADLSQKTGGIIYGDKSLPKDLINNARNLAAEGIVLLKNDKDTLPLSSKDRLSVFGRVQYNYFYVGYGSGGDVKAPYCVNLIEGLKSKEKFTLNEDLLSLYDNWCEENIPDEGSWGNWPLNFKEMPLSDEQVKAAADKSDVALVVIGRAAGEDRDQKLIKGSFYLTDEERDLLNKVTNNFNKIIVLINSGNIIDLSWLKDYGDKITSLLYVWQGGMESGNAIADVLCADVTPSGKLPDTIAIDYKDYPASPYFGNKEYNNYVEDIFVGYRYFETFEKKVLFPFGFGLSYTDFAITSDFNYNKDKITVTVNVENIGKKYAGKEVIQIYFTPPEGLLCKPKKNLIAFKKTKELQPAETQTIVFEIALEDLMSYDDSGITGHKSSYIGEEGEYTFFCGASIQSLQETGKFKLNSPIIKKMQELCAVEGENQFEVMHFKNNEKHEISFNKVATKTSNVKDLIKKNMPHNIPLTGDKGIKLIDVKEKKSTLDEFVAQLSVKELDALCRGGLRMDFNLGAKGNAGAFGGIIQSLRDKGIPPVITTDGPSGIRLMRYASLLPCGTAIASSWNTDLTQSLYNCIGKEMIEKGSDVLLAPGINIHRDPLCGRNFEYFSEDPLLSGKLAAAIVTGLQKTGVSACPKHFACNSQETNRALNDSRVSERALREIYLKNFEICIKESNPLLIMTAYNKINGIFCYNNYELCTMILRKEWGYKGSLITDWWVKPSSDSNFKNIKNAAYRIRAQVDVLMPGGSRVLGRKDNYAVKSYKKGALTLGELQRSAKNVLNFILNCNVLDKKLR